jgi:hypothetical protein
MIRTLGGIVAGLAAAVVLMMVTESIGYRVAPAPGWVDLPGGEDPHPSFLSLLFQPLGWFLGALVGGWVSIRISDQAWTTWAVAGVVLLAAVANFLFLPLPVWLIVAGLVLPALGGWLAQKVCAMFDSD